MGRLRTWVEIICVECAAQCWGRWIIGTKIPAVEFRREAKERKWRERRDGEFECPSCTKRLLGNLNKEPK